MDGKLKIYIPRRDRAANERAVKATRAYSQALKDFAGGRIRREEIDTYDHAYKKSLEERERILFGRVEEHARERAGRKAAGKYRDSFSAGGTILRIWSVSETKPAAVPDADLSSCGRKNCPADPRYSKSAGRAHYPQGYPLEIPEKLRPTRVCEADYPLYNPKPDAPYRASASSRDQQQC